MNDIQLEYARSFAEVYAIINQMPEEIKNKIPNAFKKFISEEKSKEYNPSIEIPIDDTRLMPETIVIMGMIYRDFLAPEDEKIELLERDRVELEKYEERLKQAYSIDKMFHSREKKELAIVEYKKDNIFIRIKNFIKNKLNFNKKNK